MKDVQKILKQLQDSGIPAYERFELLEIYSNNINCSEDILNLIELIYSEDNSIIRHEISAQLLRVNNKKPELMIPIQGIVENILIDISKSDDSLVSRHEAIESLSTIGSSKSIDFLLELARSEKNKDILYTIEISLPIIRNRLVKEGATANNYFIINGAAN